MRRAITKRRVRALLSLVAGVAAVVAFRPEGGLSHVTTTNTVLFDREIVDILERHCAVCHSAENLASPLETYEETWLARNDVFAEVLSRHMPPWSAVPGYGRFANDNSLTVRERQFLVSWVEGLGPRNDGAVFLNVAGAANDDPAVVSTDFTRWLLGEPDVEVALPPASAAPGSGLRRATVRFDSGLDDDLDIRSMEFRPDARTALRAASFRIEETGQWLGRWTPWQGFVTLPPGNALRVPAGSRILAELVFGPGEAAGVTGRIGFRRAEGGATPLLDDLVLEPSGSIVPGAEAEFRRIAEAGVDAGFRLLAIDPEFDAGIRSLEVSIRRPDGGTDVVLFLRDIRTDWPTPYLLEQPLDVVRGARIRAVAYGDVSTSVVRVTLQRAALRAP